MNNKARITIEPLAVIEAREERIRIRRRKAARRRRAAQKVAKLKANGQ